jgi:hypothetical protein
MTSYELSPDVAGGLGPATEWESATPDVVTSLEFEFAGWDGDDLVASFPVTLATARLREAVEASGLTGITFAPVLVSRWPEYDESNQPDLPQWYRLQPVGTPEVDDAWTGRKMYLTVSERMLQLLQRFDIKDCEITPVR